MTLAILRNGFRSFFGNQQDTTDIEDGHQEDGNHQDWNDEDWSYNGCMFTIGTSGECVCNDCTMRASCNGLYERGCASTGRSTDDPQLFNSCRRLRLLLQPCRPLLLPSWASGSPHDTSERKIHRYGTFARFLSAFTESLPPSIAPLHSVCSNFKSSFFYLLHSLVFLIFLHAQPLTLLRFMIYLKCHSLRPKSSGFGTNWQEGCGNYINYAGKECFHTTSETFLSFSAAEYETFLSIRS